MRTDLIAELNPKKNPTIRQIHRTQNLKGNYKKSFSIKDPYVSPYGSCCCRRP